MLGGGTALWVRARPRFPSRQAFLGVVRTIFHVQGRLRRGGLMPAAAPLTPATGDRRCMFSGHAVE